MKKLYTLVIKSYIGPLIMTFFIALFVLLMQFLWKYVDELVGKGLEWYIIAELLFYASATFVPMALPLAILLSSLMTFGNLGEHYELVAAKAAGISLRKTMMPLIAISLIISMAAFYFSNNILPIANLKMASLLYDVREQRPALNIKEGVFYDGIDNFVIKVGKKDKDGETIYDVMIYDHTENSGSNNLTLAEWGTMSVTEDNMFLIFKLYNGVNYHEPLRTREQVYRKPMQRTYFKEERRRFDLSGFAMKRSDDDIFKDHYRMLNLKQLVESKDSLTIDLKKENGELYKYIFNSFRFFNMMADTNYQKVEVPDSLRSGTELFANLDDHNRHRVIETSINSARNVQSMIENHYNGHKATTKQIIKHEVEWHRKFTLSIACLILFFIGAPLGAIIRKGGLGMPIVVSVVLFIIYHVISMTGEKSAKEGVIDPYMGMWIASAILLPLGIFLTYKSTTDSPLLDADRWKKIFSFLNIFSLKKKKDENPPIL